ncbi:TonB-dependent receptor [Trinickia dinghuensis]|uniref:TonB-dependent receptor n=1 Tax=Trinickia dinghuensis TaxID=2291023 RepID=A0A3D8JZX4_9BURK|nr:TonB-dependent receptor [Trinickia dinghuensis]
MIRSTDHVHPGQRHNPRPPSRRTRLAGCFAASALAGLAPFASAQTGPARALPVAAAPSPAASDGATYSATLQPVVVVGTTPLVGIGLPLSQVAANVQVVHGHELSEQHRETLTDYFEKNLPSVDVNDAQGNPYQMNINYRGFSASPLLGTPEGLSVFMDGVRINEPFGDAVNWDLIPQQAIDTIELVPGSSPTFGLNTLGGAIAISTKNGKDDPGGDVEVTGGSWGRKTVEVEQGGTIGHNLDYYVTGNVANDNGWGESNSSRVRQGFGKLRYSDADTTIALSAGGADNDLQGTQTIPRSFLDDFRQAYTFPDQNLNSVGYTTLSGEHFFNDRTELSGNVYFRRLVSKNISSNNNNDYGSVQSDGSIDTLQGSNVESMVGTDSYGASLQLTLLGQLGGMKNQFVAGVAVDFANSHYTESEQDAYFLPSRATVGIGGYTQQVNAKTRDANLAAYLQDTLSLTKQWTLTLSGRYNWAKSQIGDESGTQPQLDGSHVFSRLNPAIGLNWNPTPGFTAYATYNEGMRTPTAIELECADPTAPCSLPNDFVADPALSPVISKTIEAGARGRIGSATTWSAAVYRTTLDNDIEFISSPTATQGFFQNVGNTRRQGFELSGHTQLGKLGVTANYSYIDATYRSSWTESSPSNSSADANGNITVQPGNHLPGIPANTVKLRLDYAATPKWTIGTNVTYRGDIYAQGDENNQDVNGKIAGYVLVDFDTAYQVTKRLRVFATVTNVFDKRYASFGVLGQNFFNGPGHTFDGSAPVSEQFVGPGAPRGAWVGVRYAWN